METTFSSILLALLSSFIGSFGAIYIKKGTSSFGFSHQNLFRNFSLIMGVCIYGISAIIFIFALKNGEISMIYPLAATSYIWITVLSRFFLHEKITQQKIFAILFIILGASIIGL